MESGAQTILTNVGQLVGQEFWQLRAVGGEIAELKEELATMTTLLRMQSEANESGLCHFVREWMKQLRELAYDAEDCVDLYLFRIRCRQGDGFLVWSKRLLATLFPRHRLAGEITALRLRAVSISERHARYVVSLDLLGRAASPAPAPLEAVAASASALHPNNKDPNQLVGIKAQAEQLANKVKAGEGERLKVFSIVGFGGLGKTTLAMEVCRLLETEFPRQAKVSASQTFGSGSQDIEGLLKRLLRQIMQFQSEPVASQQSEQASEGVGLQCEETTEPDKLKRAAEAAAKLLELLGKIDRMNLGELQGMLEKSLGNNRY